MTWKNQLYFGDNLDIMRECIPYESVDLIYLNPPFNGKANYDDRELQYPKSAPQTFKKAQRKSKDRTEQVDLFDGTD